MATYYVDGVNGSDANAGTSVGAAWATFTKAVNSGGIADTTVANTIYVAAGTYKAVYAPTLTSPTATQTYIADVDGSHFGNAGGAVILTAYTTNNSTAPSTSTLLAIGSKNNMTFTGFILVGGNTSASCVSNTAGAINIIFNDCTFFAGRQGSLVTMNAKVSAGSGWRCNRCRFWSPANSNAFGCTGASQSSGADWDVDIILDACIFFGGGNNQIAFTGSGANTFKPGGLIVRNCIIMGTVITTTTSTTVPLVLRNCILTNGSVLLNAGASGQIDEDYCFLFGSNAPRTNVTVGTNSSPTPSASEWLYAPMFELGQSAYEQRVPPHVMTPMAGNGLFGRGTSVGNTTDLLNRMRPAGGNSATVTPGALERHDTAISPGTTVGADSGSGYIELVGVGDQDFDEPVDAVATTFTIKVKTSGYSGTNYPQMKIVNGGECGVADASVNATSASASAYESISIGPFTPTARGIVTVRLVNRSANGTGIAAFDSFAAS